MKKHKKLEKCYMCDDTATSKEHVPPQCLFPEKKDISTDIFRSNLITVPSCDLHNSKKSQDDEFLMASLAGIAGNNSVGIFHMQTKVKRAVDRRQYDFINTYLKNRKEIIINTQTGAIKNVMVGNPDVQRLYKCFDSIAYGLYYYKFNKTFKGEIRLFFDFLFYEEENMEKFKTLISTRFKIENIKSEGCNPEIFKYAFHKPDRDGLIALELCFYGGTKVYIAYMPQGIEEPVFLLKMLIDAGIPTTVNFGKDLEIKFN